MTLARKNPGSERIRGPMLWALKGIDNDPRYLFDSAPMEEAIRRADESGLVLASNKRLSKALIRSNAWRAMRGIRSCWTGTMAAYDSPDKELGKTIESTDSKTDIRYIFPVPEEHQGKKNVVLVSEHPDFAIEYDGKTRIVLAKKVDAVQEFPAFSRTFYLGDPKYDIPSGNEVYSTDRAARCLYRYEKNVGLVTRNFWDDARRDVLLLSAPYNHFSIVVEIPDYKKSIRFGGGREARVVARISEELARVVRNAKRFMVK